MALVIEIERHGGLPVVHLHGELDIYTVPNFTSAADESLTADRAIVVVLDGVDLVDSSGLAALLRLTRPGGQTRRVVLVSRQGWMEQLLEIAHLSDRFVVVGDLDAALEALGAAPR